MADQLFQRVYNDAINRVSRLRYAPRKRKLLSLVTATVAGTTNAAATAASAAGGFSIATCANVYGPDI